MPFKCNLQRYNVGVFRAVAKAEIRVIPIFGWGCKLNGFAYVQRKWARDAAYLKRWMSAQVARAVGPPVHVDSPFPASERRPPGFKPCTNQVKHNQRNFNVCVSNGACTGTAWGRPGGC